MKRALLLVLMIASGHMSAQLPAMLKGMVRDSISGEALSGAVIQVKGTTYSARTNRDGRFTLSINIRESFTASVHIYLTGYREKVIAVMIRPARTAEVDFQMAPEYYIYDEVMVVGRLTPDTVWGSDAMNVCDFAFYGDSILLLTYQAEKRWKRQEESTTTIYGGGELVLLDTDRKEVARCIVPEPVLKLYKGFFDEVFVIGKSTVFEVRLDNGVYLVPVSSEYFSDWIKPIVDSIGAKIYFSTFNPDYPAFEYKLFDRTDSSYHGLRYLIDEKTMELFRSEFKYLGPREKLSAFRYELATGIDKEIVAAYMSGFQNSPYYSPLNIPLVVSNDTVLIFDHNHDKLFRYNDNGSIIDSCFISYHKCRGQEKWGGEILRDEVTEEVYTYNSKNGYTYLYRLNVHNGSYQPVSKLHFRYVENVSVRNGYIYYIYRPFESSQKRFLYREKTGV